MVAGKPMIELRQLRRNFGATRAVDNVSFEVPQGHVFGYIGPNGAGKTTSMRILATLDLPTGGDAYIDGFSVIDDPDRVRRRLGFMPDAFGTYANCNVREYLDFFARGYGLRGKERQAAMTHVMGFTGLEPLADKPTKGLSKGMRQRLCLGRSMIHSPAVLVLDEPAAGLDPRARIELREMIRELADSGTTILISSHILTELAEMCDLVGIIEQGQLLAIGGIDEIQQRHRAQQITRTVSTELLDDPNPLIEWLDARDDVDKINRTGRQVIFQHDGNAESEAALLRQMIEANFRVLAFGSQSESLEDVFMQITRGRVQ